jgi:actin-related protein
VHDGFVLQKSVVKFDIGGEFLTDRIHEYLLKVYISIAYFDYRLMNVCFFF